MTMSADFSVRRFRDWSSLRTVIELHAEIGIEATTDLCQLARQLLDGSVAIEALNACLEHSLDSPSATVAQLDNLRGRSASTLAPEEFRANTSSTEVAPEEMLLVQGMISHPPFSIGEGSDSELARTADEVIKRPKIEYERTHFEFRGLSQFRSMGRKSIVHDLQCYHSDILRLLRPKASLAELLTDKDISLSKLRIGLERFKSRVVFSVFGLVPSLREKLYLELLSDKLVVSWEKSSGLSHKAPAFESSDLLFQLGKAIEESNICPDFKEKVRFELCTLHDSQAS